MTAALGGVPTIKLDVPITAVFLVLFVCGAAAHMTIFQNNKRRGHKFIMSGVMFGFCMSRIATTTLRIVWANYPHNIRLAIAAQIFVAAGVVLLYVINLLFAQRILRATHPKFGWSKGVSIGFKVLYALIVIFLIMLITATIDSFYTLNKHIRTIDRRLQLSGQSYYALVSFLPIPIVYLALSLPRKNSVEKFGSGRWATKINILLIATILLCLGASFRLGTNFKNPRPREDPAWYHSKACFYIFNFTVEILVIYLYLLVRVDRRFHVPNNSHGPGDYSRHVGHDSNEQSNKVNGAQSQRGGFHIASEEEVFDDKDPEEVNESEKRGVDDVETGRRVPDPL